MILPWKQVALLATSWTCLSGLSVAPSCPDLASLRSASVLSTSFDPGRISGLYFEQAYIDPAQVGATCQTLNSTYNATNDILTMPFSVEYFGQVPFTIVEQYTPHGNGTDSGMYDKVALPPVGSTAADSALVLPTVVVDVTGGGDTDPYDTMTLYSCLQVGQQVVTELIFASLSKMLTTDELVALEDTAKASGVQWDEAELTLVNQTSC